MCVEVGSFFLLFREGLVEFEVWVGSSSTETGRETTVGVRLGVVVCVDDPTAHQLTSGSNMKPHANTHSCFRPHIRPSAQRYVCAGVVVVVAVGEGVEEVRGGRKECVRGISERGRERRGEGGRRNDTKEKCACEQVCMKGCPVQSIKNFEPAIRQMACGPKANKMTTVLSCRNLFLIRL